ncbi:hypothetical protein C8R44DRAFT_979658 [Mycena epipterygia]|nr:hypothetical protein C8R44DRAFT_979658 [Mycena epipterygia]
MPKSTRWTHKCQWTSLPIFPTYPTGTGSPITAEAVAAQSLSAGVEDIIIDPITSKVYFAQKRPEENGRSVIVDASDRKDMFGGSWDARSQLHEYGGAASTVFGDVLYFSHTADHRVYKTTKGGKPEPITPVNPAKRFADFAVHPKNPNLIVCSMEDHTNPHPDHLEPKPADDKSYKPADFYACAQMANLWYHPELPWQSAEIVVASVTVPNDQTLELNTFIHIAGKTEEISAQDPNWASNDTVYFTCDKNGYQNPWKFTLECEAAPILSEPVLEEFGVPQWWLSRHGSGALTATNIIFLSFSQGRPVLSLCDLELRKRTIVPTEYAHIEYIHGNGNSKVVMLGQPADKGEVLAELTLHGGEIQLKSLSPPPIKNEKLPIAFISPESTGR